MTTQEMNAESRATRLGKLGDVLQLKQRIDELAQRAQHNYEMGGDAAISATTLYWRSLAGPERQFIRSFTKDQLASAIGTLIEQDPRIRTGYASSFNLRRPTFLLHSLAVQVTVRFRSAAWN